MKSDIESLSEDNIKKIIFIIFLLFSIHFWDLKFIPQKYNIENLLTYIVGLYCLFKVDKNENLRFKNAILLFIIGLFFNSLAAYINLKQSPFRTLLSFEFYYFILLYFLLHYLKLNRKFLENIIIIFAIIYSIIFLYQYRIYPDLILKHDPNTARWSWQFEILGHGFLMLAYFLVLNRYLLKQKILNIFLAIGFLFVLFKSDFRTLIIGAVLVTIIMLIRTIYKGKNFISIVFVFLLLIVFSQHPKVSKVIHNIITKTESNIAEGDKYVRYVEFDFYFKRFPKNLSYFIIGSGKPTGANLWNFNRGALGGLNYNFVWVDIGLLGFYIVIGALTTLGLLWYTVKSIFIRLPRDRFYLNFYFLYLLIVSFTNEEIYRNGIFSVHAIALYLIDITVNEKIELEKKALEIEASTSIST